MRPTALLWPRGRTATLGAAAALLNAVARVALVPLFVLPLFDRVLTGDVDALPGVVALTGAVVLVGALALWAQDALLGAAAATLSARWRERLYGALLARPPGSLPGSSGGLASRVLTDLREVETYFQFGLGTVVAESATTVGIVGYLFVTDARATGLLLLFGLPTALALQLVGRRLEAAATGSQQATEELGKHLQEGLRHHSLVRAFRADSAMLRRFGPANARARGTMTRRGVLAGLQVPLAQLLVFAALVLLVVILVGRVQEGAMSQGELVAYITLVALLATPIQLLPKGLALLVQARAAARRLVQLLGPPEPQRATGASVSNSNVPNSSIPDISDASFTLKGVRANYGSEAVLEGVDLVLPARGMVAIHGESGAGKSTLLKLLLGFLGPSAGSVSYGGQPLELLDDTELRRRLGYVPQDSALLSGSLRDNLLLGRDLPDAALWSVLEAVGVAKAVRALSAGLDHALAEDGGGLSGGQQQRLAIARALLSDPAALLLDEPTANLDAESERALVATLRAQAAQRLVVTVAHRPALIEAADLALEVAGGRVRQSRPVPS